MALALQITKEGEKGLGVRTTRPFGKGELVCEYSGDLLDMVSIMPLLLIVENSSNLIMQFTRHNFA